MHCMKCQGELEVVRVCSRVYVRCTGCKNKFQIHEIAHLLDEKTEAILERYNCIIYD